MDVKVPPMLKLRPLGVQSPIGGVLPAMARDGLSSGGFSES